MEAELMRSPVVGVDLDTLNIEDLNSVDLLDASFDTGSFPLQEGCGHADLVVTHRNGETLPGGAGGGGGRESSFASVDLFPELQSLQEPGSPDSRPPTLLLPQAFLSPEDPCDCADHIADENGPAYWAAVICAPVACSSPRKEEDSDPVSWSHKAFSWSGRSLGVLEQSRTDEYTNPEKSKVFQQPKAYRPRSRGLSLESRRHGQESSLGECSEDTPSFDSTCSTEYTEDTITGKKSACDETLTRHYWPHDTSLCDYSLKRKKSHEDWDGDVSVKRSYTNRAKPSEESKELLEWNFQQNPYPTKEDKEHMAREMQITMTYVNGWFSRRRSREREKNIYSQGLPWEETHRDLATFMSSVGNQMDSEEQSNHMQFSEHTLVLDERPL